MRVGISILLLVAALAGNASAAPRYPNGALALESKLLASQSDETKVWIKDEAAREATSRFVSADTPRNAARKNGSMGSDVSVMAFLILMQTARDADDNVSQIVNGVQSVGASRQDVRQQQMANSDISGAQQSQMSGGLQEAQQAQGTAMISLLPSDQPNPIAAARAPKAVPPLSMSLQDAMDQQGLIEDLLADAYKRANQPG